MAAWLSVDSLLQSEIDDGAEGSLYKSLQSKNEEQIKKLDERITDAQANEGETELSDALRARASYLAKIGEKEKALEAYETAYAKQAGLGSKIDLRLAMIRVGFFHGDFTVINAQIEKTQACVVLSDRFTSSSNYVCPAASSTQAETGTAGTG